MRNEQKVLIAGEEEREREHPQQRRAQKKSSLWRAGLSSVYRYAHENDAPPSQAAITRLKGKGNEFRNEDEEGWKEGRRMASVTLTLCKEKRVLG